MSHPARVNFQTPAQAPTSRKAMIEYLRGHPRYDTMRSWNHCTSYARCIKVSHLNWPSNEVRGTAYEMLTVSEALDEFWGPLRSFGDRHGHIWQIGGNGRSNGYVVLYQGGMERSGHHSHCTVCGQQNYAKVLLPAENPTPEQNFERYYIEHHGWPPFAYPTKDEVKTLGMTEPQILDLVARLRQEWNNERPNVTFHNRCGRCGENARVNYDEQPLRILSYPGRGVDMDDDFEDWSTDDLLDRVAVVYDFDSTVDAGIAAFTAFCESHTVVDDVVYVPRPIKRAESRNQTE